MIPALHHHLPHRTSGSFGTSLAGRVAEWITTKWLRFDVFVVWIAVINSVIWQWSREPSSAIMSLIVSPIVAIVSYAILKTLFVIIWFIPGLNVVFGSLRLLYIWIFCRIIVQESPIVEIPLWAGKS